MTRAPLAPILFKTKEGLSPQAPESKHLKKTNETSLLWAKLSKQGLSHTPKASQKSHAVLRSAQIAVLLCDVKSDRIYLQLLEGARDQKNIFVRAI
jgi:hypothetical protein